MSIADNETLVRQIFDAFARKEGFALRGCLRRGRSLDGAGHRGDGGRVPRSRPDLPLSRTTAEGDRRDVRLGAPRRARERRSCRRALSGAGHAPRTGARARPAPALPHRGRSRREVLALPSDPPRSTLLGAVELKVVGDRRVLRRRAASARSDASTSSPSRSSSASTSATASPGTARSRSSSRSPPRRRRSRPSSARATRLGSRSSHAARAPGCRAARRRWPAESSSRSRG